MNSPTTWQAGRFANTVDYNKFDLLTLKPGEVIELVTENDTYYTIVATVALAPNDGPVDYWVKGVVIVSSDKMMVNPLSRAHEVVNPIHFACDRKITVGARFGLAQYVMTAPIVGIRHSF